MTRGSSGYRMPGLTLIELLVILAILAIALTIGVPSLQTLLERGTLRAAAQALAIDLQWTRSEALKRNQPLTVSFDSEHWCFGISALAECDCRVTDREDPRACTLGDGHAAPARLLTTSRADYPSVRLATTLPATQFDPRRGTARNGTIRLSTGHASAGRSQSLHVILSRLGRVRVCTPAEAPAIAGYPSCG